MRENKKNLNSEDEIQKRIRELIFEESERENRELEKKLDDEATAEALHEVTGVSKKKIAAITKKVRTEHSQKNKHKKKHRRTPSFRAIFFTPMALMMCIMFVATVIGSKEKRKDKEIQKAIREENMQLLRHFVIDKGYDLNGGYSYQLYMTNDSSTYFPLLHAIRAKQKGIALFLINNGALIAPNSTTRNDLTEIVEKNKDKELKQAMAKAMAKQAGEGSAVAKLLDKGYSYFKTDFCRAVSDEDCEALKLFKEAQKDEFDNEWHNQGLALAASRNKPDIVNFFFNNWSSFSQRALNVAFHKMVYRGDKATAQELLDKGASVDARFYMTVRKNRKPQYYPGTWWGAEVTALETAFLNSKTEMAKWLIGKGASIDIGYFLPLNIPFELGRANGKFTEEHYKMIKLLVENGAWVNKKYGGKRPLYNAKKIKKKGIRGVWLNKAIELLESNGATE